GPGPCPRGAGGASPGGLVYTVHPIDGLVRGGGGRADAASAALRWAAVVLGLALAVCSVAVAEIDLGRYSLGAVSTAIIAAVVLCFAAIGPIVRCTAAAARMFGAAGALGATTLERAPRRVWATVMTVLIGVAATVSMGGATTNMVDSATTTFQDLAKNDVYVSPASMAQFPTGPLLPAGLKDRIAAVPGVRSVSPAQMAFATLGAGRVMLQGFPADARETRMHMLDAAAAAPQSAGEGVAGNPGQPPAKARGAGTPQIPVVSGRYMRPFPDEAPFRQ
ncbi:ABC transporter permease, partial [Nocardia brasiliensis]|uniref:ABC transporter permease n=1 Tax=Nocardia brasiliensis TaxID=37326 RepID=UPI00245910DC